MAGLGRRSHYRKHLTHAVLYDYPEPNADVGERIAKVLGSRGSNILEIIVAPPVRPRSHTSTTINGNNNAAVPIDGNESSSSGTEGESSLKECQQLSNSAFSTTTTMTTTERQQQHQEPQLAMLPSKFRKLVWVKRGDYIIVTLGSDEKEAEMAETRGIKVRYLVTNVLYKDQIKHLKNICLWPDSKCCNGAFSSDHASSSRSDDELIMNKREEEEEEDRMRRRVISLSNRAELGCVENSNVSEEGDGKDQVGGGDGICSDDYCASYSDDTDEDKDDELFVNTNRISKLAIADSDSEDSTDGDN